MADDDEYDPDFDHVEKMISDLVDACMPVYEDNVRIFDSGTNATRRVERAEVRLMLVAGLRKRGYDIPAGYETERRP